MINGNECASEGAGTPFWLGSNVCSQTECLRHKRLRLNGLIEIETADMGLLWLRHPKVASNLGYPVKSDGPRAQGRVAGTLPQNARAHADCDTSAQKNAIRSSFPKE